MAVLSLSLSACKASYPKENLKESVEKLFQKDLGVKPETKLAGKTLYVSFPIENLVSKNFELPKEVVQKLEDAMIAITRISLSTDADVQFTVLEAKDLRWGVQTNILRRMQDLKGLMYWGVSKQDFDERLVLETKKIVESSPEDWHEITLHEFMARWVASRMSLGSRANPFLGVLLGIEKVTQNYDEEQQLLFLQIEGSASSLITSTATLTMDLLKGSITEQMASVEKKYPASAARKASPFLKTYEEGLFRDPFWAREVVILDHEGKELFRIPKKDWTKTEQKMKEKKSLFSKLRLSKNRKEE